MIPQPNMIPVWNGNQLLGYYYEFVPDVIYYPRCANHNFSNGFDRLLHYGLDYKSYYRSTPDVSYTKSALWANVFKLITNHNDVETIRGLEETINDPMGWSPDGYVYFSQRNNEYAG